MLYTYNNHILLAKKVEFMKMTKNVALMMVGAGAVLAYQKYSKPAMKELSKTMDKALDKADKKLENMMK